MNAPETTNQRLNSLNQAIASYLATKEKTSKTIADLEQSLNSELFTTLHEVIAHIRFTDAGWTQKLQSLLQTVAVSLPVQFTYCERVVRAHVANELIILAGTKKSPTQVFVKSKRMDFFYPENSGIDWQSCVENLNSSLANVRQAVVNEKISLADVKKDVAQARKAERELEAENAKRDLIAQGYNQAVNALTSKHDKEISAHEQTIGKLKAELETALAELQTLRAIINRPVEKGLFKVA